MLLLGPSLSSKTFLMLFIHWAFPFCSFLRHILLQKFVSFASSYWFVFVQQLVEFSFVILECFVFIVWSCPEIFWVFLLSPISFDLFLPVVLSNLSAVVFLGFFLSVLFLYISTSSVSLVIAVSLFVFLSSFPSQGLYFCSESLRVYLFYYWLFFFFVLLTFFFIIIIDYFFSSSINSFSSVC